MNAAIILHGNNVVCNGDFHEMTMQRLLGSALCTPGDVVTHHSKLRCLAAAHEAFPAHPRDE